MNRTFQIIVALSALVFILSRIPSGWSEDFIRSDMQGIEDCGQLIWTGGFDGMSWLTIEGRNGATHNCAVIEASGVYSPSGEYDGKIKFLVSRAEEPGWRINFTFGLRPGDVGIVLTDEGIWVIDDQIYGIGPEIEPGEWYTLEVQSKGGYMFYSISRGEYSWYLLETTAPASMTGVSVDVYGRVAARLDFVQINGLP